MRRPKTPLALWIKSQREARGWKAEELARRLRDAGYRAEDATVRAWEANRKPGDDVITGMEKLFGAIAPKDSEPTGDMAGLVAAISSLVEELRLSRQEQARWNKGVEEALAALRSGRTPGVPTADPAAPPREDALPEPRR